jgi:predicted RNase H-like nuclease (RuvC/YqgF family)
MNLELLNEIAELRKLKLSDTEISNIIGISKQNMLLMLRVQKVVTEQNLLEIKTLEDEIISSNEFLSDLKKENSDLKVKLSQYDVLNIEDLQEENEKLKFCIDDLQKENEKLSLEFDSLEKEYLFLEDEYSRIPLFLKKIYRLSK